MKHYRDYFTVPANYRAVMTREAINETPETWLDFYPHATYIDLLNTLFDERRSLWITGNFGTGKSNAALVTQKLFMDDISRVEKWFEINSTVIKNRDALREKLIQARESGILVVYDYNASGIDPNEGFLVRLEKGVLTALSEQGYVAPAKANLDSVIERLRREGQHFFALRDEMLNEMKSLKSNVNTVDALEALLRAESTAETPTHYLEDVQAVFHRDNIYLDINVTSFRNWISAILEANHLRRVIYIFDEFTEFVENNSSQLKTFEDVTEAPDINHFYLVPVTHKELQSYIGENATGVKRANERFYFRNLQMPNDIAFQMAGRAMKPISEDAKKEWEREREVLWNSIVTVVDRFNAPETSAAYVSRESFQNILPIHPMAAFLLKFLAEQARSNQRSIFEYLKGSADGQEFQEFIVRGGPAVINAQFLTPDYLWKYFMERSDAGKSREVTEIKLDYDRIVAREFLNYGDDQPEIRVLKTAMLFLLLARLMPNGHDRLLPTVENVELSFRGDGTIMDVGMILRDLAENRHCFSIVDGHIELYSTTVGGDDLRKKIQELTGSFHDLLHNYCKEQFESHTRSARAGFSAERFDIRASDASHTTLTNITSTRDKYSQNITKDNGSICLWFVVAKERSDQFSIPEKCEKLLSQLYDHRIIMFAFPENTFCRDNTNLWNEYITFYAQYLLENSKAAKDQIEKSYCRIRDEWMRTLKSSNTAIESRYYDASRGGVVCERYTWVQLKGFLQSYARRTLAACPDLLTDQTTAFGNKALRAWALAGMRFSGQAQQGQLVSALKAQGVLPEDAWFEGHPAHVFGRIRALLEKKYANTVGKGTEFSLRKVYIELQRAPYGMRYNALSAFTLGFCCAWMLQKNCQWTNRQMTLPLDEETLAEIIEATVSGKAADKEKYICRLSKEDKAFAKNAGRMFGLPALDDSTPLKALNEIANKVENESMKVPLWVMAEYMRDDKPENALAADVLEWLCKALQTSSKGNNSEKTGAITEIGRALREHPELADTVAAYTNSATYLCAFRKYVDDVDPELAVLAEQVEDQTHQYCDMILNAARPSAGWLWNRIDISTEIEKVHRAYQLMVQIRGLLQLRGYSSFSDTLARLSAKIDRSGIPHAIVADRYPSVGRLIDAMNGQTQDASLIYKAFEDSREVLEKLYTDPTKSALVELAEERLGDMELNQDELRSALSVVANMPEYDAGMTAEDYISLFRREIEKKIRNSTSHRALEEWHRITHTATLKDWCLQTKLPVWTVFARTEGGDELERMLRSPEAFSSNALEQKLRILESLPEIQLTDCQESFLRDAVPAKYQKLGIRVSSLMAYFENKYGENRDNWPKNSDIQDFIKTQYQAELAPNILSHLRDKNAETLKNRILELAASDPDIGLKLLELLTI